MALTNAPTAAEIRIASRLRPEQVARSMTGDTALEVDIGTRITEQSSYVEMRLNMSAAPQPWPFAGSFLSGVYPEYDSAAITAVGTRQGKIAALAVKLLTLGDLYDSAGQLNERYQAEADNYLARGEALLTQLTSELSWQAARGADTDGGGLSILTVTVGENFPSEYA